MKFEVEMRHQGGRVRAVTVSDDQVQRYGSDLGKMIGTIILNGSLGRRDPIFAGDIVRYLGKRYLVKFKGFVEIPNETDPEI